jgi:hypothetical protein
MHKQSFWEELGENLGFIWWSFMALIFIILFALAYAIGIALILVTLPLLLSIGTSAGIALIIWLTCSLLGITIISGLNKVYAKFWRDM